MRKATAMLALAALLMPSPAMAWGVETHKFIVSRAIDMLPAAIRPFFEANRVFIVEHCIDPDLWRTAGFTEESPRHFLDMDAYGKTPFTDLPRDYDAALVKFGAETLARNGVLPWRTSEMAGNLWRGFQSASRGNAYGTSDVNLFSALGGHYVADGHVPFHAALNYDGQLSGQNGVHSRFEEELFVRYGRQLNIQPPPLASVPNVRDFMFDTLIESFQNVDAVLAADREAIGSGETYDDRYFDAFFTKIKPVLEKRISQAISGVASIITSEWELAGRPPLPANPPPRPPARRRAAATP